MSQKKYKITNVDALHWLAEVPANSIHAVVSDPPYGLVEFSSSQLEKRRNGNGGIWRLPQAYDGHQRSPVPRFTVLGPRDHQRIRRFFRTVSRLLLRALVPGGHVIIASNPLVSHLVAAAFVASGFEKRGEIIRIVHTLRGGDRPKAAHREFPAVSVIPKSCWEPWLLFRKPCEGRVQDNLRKWKTGGLRRKADGKPFSDVMSVGPARGEEKQVAPHPALKPQRLVRQLVYAALPLGQGTVLDPFMGSGAVIAAAESLGYRSIGLELDLEYFKMAVKAIPKLSRIQIPEDSSRSLTVRQVNRRVSQRHP